MSYVMVAIGGLNAMQQIQAGKTAQAQGDLRGDALDYQAKIENDAALQTAAVIRRAGRRQVGQANAAYAGAGVKVGEGSALETERQITQDSEHDAFQALLAGSRRASGLRTDATMSRINGDMQETAGYVNAAGTLLSTGYQAQKGWKTRVVNNPQG